jgi:alkylhydroperoxidase family enzyme
VNQRAQLTTPAGLASGVRRHRRLARHGVLQRTRTRRAGYADTMSRDIDVLDAVFDALREHVDERQIVELTVLIGVYNMHTRVGQALQIDPEPHHP